jgi:protein-disulfide isomerase
VRSAPIRTGITEEGHFWIGAEKPVLDIMEFTDYQCFQCRKMHYYLRELVARHPDKLRLTHCNFPMDQEYNPIVTEPFHVGSGRMALLAIHAAVKGKFIELNDLLFVMAASGKPIDLTEVAIKTGIDLHELQLALTHEPYMRHLLRDIRLGMKLRIYGTPSYLINGKVYEGNIPAEILKPVLDGKP